MIEFLCENWGGVLVLSLVAAAAGLAARGAVRRRRAGCGCGCADCPSRGACRRDA